MPLAAAGVVKLGDDVIPLAAATIVANNIMTWAAAAPLAAAATAVVKRATSRVRPRRCRCRHCRRRQLADGMRLHCPRLVVCGSSNVNKG